jgi:hypothetical protein
MLFAAVLIGCGGAEPHFVVTGTVVEDGKPYVIPEEQYEGVELPVVAGDDEEGRGVLRFLLLGEGWRRLFVEIALDELDLDRSTPAEIDLQPGGGSVEEVLDGDAGAAGPGDEVLGVFGGGWIHLEGAGYDPGDPIRGSFSASLYPYQE